MNTMPTAARNGAAGSVSGVLVVPPALTANRASRPIRDVRHDTPTDAEPRQVFAYVAGRPAEDDLTGLSPRPAGAAAGDAG